MEHPMNKRSFTIMDNENLLNSIYQNIAMVLETIPEIRKVTTDCDFKALIISQEEEYQNLSDSIKDTITSNGDSTEELNDLLKTYSEWMTKLKAMSDKNVSHLSEMCIQGYTMGMITAIQKNHLYCDASKEAKHFSDKLISLHEKSIQDLKKYL